MQADSNLSHIFPAFREKVVRITAYINAYLAKHHPGMTAKVIEGFRPQARQVELWFKGRNKSGKIVSKKDVVTYKNGTSNPSDHQKALAVDFGIFQGGKYIEEPPADVWAQLQHAAHVEGVESGSDWKTFVDAPHVAWNTSDKNTYALAKAWKKTQELV